jgi:hypothetical protein
MTTATHWIDGVPGHGENLGASVYTRLKKKVTFFSHQLRLFTEAHPVRQTVLFLLPEPPGLAARQPQTLKNQPAKEKHHWKSVGKSRAACRMRSTFTRLRSAV